MRVNGRARISVEPALLARFAVQGKPPQCVLTIAVETAFFQCARAIQRAQLWAPASDHAQIGVPTADAMLAALSGRELGGEAYDRELPQRQRETLY